MIMGGSFIMGVKTINRLEDLPSNVALSELRIITFDIIYSLHTLFEYVGEIFSLSL